MKVAGHLLIGVVVVVCATAVHRYPLGLLLGIATSIVLLVTIRPGWTTRTAYAAGWLLGGVVLVRERPEGDAWFLGDLSSYALMGVALVMAAVGLATLPPRRHLSSGG
ncbi:DUF6113 family protein [Nocardioides massiliensis]|uniref:Uncharacterized protein n=1 Tax=Nocardioides massiliensis TaxID=1325935 RepID=A0ABT9NJF3_9ACTN|nr:DUF6113 family protein [Nocardioides massiliensis]MDP9820552.1 hypothetical protein [Nocardioides massiliensis]